MIKIDEKLCKGCSICVHFCPVKALKTSKKLNEKGYFLPVPAREDKCTKCRFCEQICPEFAIHIIDNQVFK